MNWDNTHVTIHYLSLNGDLKGFNAHIAERGIKQGEGVTRRVTEDGGDRWLNMVFISGEEDIEIRETYSLRLKPGTTDKELETQFLQVKE